MPPINGIQFLKLLRSSGDVHPFIVFTRKGREEIVIETFNSGADTYVQKGGSPKAQFAELAHKIQQGMDRRNAENALERSNSALRATLDVTPDGILVTGMMSGRFIRKKTHFQERDRKVSLNRSWQGIFSPAVYFFSPVPSLSM